MIQLLRYSSIIGILTLVHFFRAAFGDPRQLASPLRLATQRREKIFAIRPRLEIDSSDFPAARTSITTITILARIFHERSLIRISNGNLVARSGQPRIAASPSFQNPLRFITHTMLERAATRTIANYIPRQ